MVRYFEVDYLDVEEKLQQRFEMETAPQMEPLEPVPVSKSVANAKSSLLPKQFPSTAIKAEERKERSASATC